MMVREPKGWCPSAYRPMKVEDGLLARIRPPLCRLTKTQALGLCQLADACGNGLIEFTNRANLQVRGLTDHSHQDFLEGLTCLKLLDPDEESEKRRSIVVEPFWQEGDDTECFATELAKRLHDLPDLPAKFGFVIDLGPEPLLQTTSGDIRVERGLEGLILRANGAANGRFVTRETWLDSLIEMSHWFAERWTQDHRRMAQVVGENSLPTDWNKVAPVPQQASVAPGLHDMGHLIQFPEPPIRAEALADAIEGNGASAIRLTPWRLVLLEGAVVGAIDQPASLAC